MLRLGALGSLLVALILVGGCSHTPPIVPADTAAMVNEQGRERTYDLVWQDIRRFEGALERGESANFAEEALVILSRINRLAEGKASGMSEATHVLMVDTAKAGASQLDPQERQELLHETATELRTAFDAGNFAKAQEKALQAYGYSRAIEDTP